MLKSSNITSMDIEKKLSSMTYSGQSRAVDPLVENSNIPYFSLAFFSYVFHNDNIPNEKELWNSYVELNGIAIDGEFMVIDGNKYGKEGVENRMLRAYPSLIRDFHFYKICEESGMFQKVKFSTKMDISEGIDLLIEQDHGLYCVSLYTDTKRGKDFKGIKNKRRHDYSLCKKEIGIPIDLSITNVKIKTVSNFKLLSNAYISELQKKIKDD